MKISNLKLQIVLVLLLLLTQHARAAVGGVIGGLPTKFIPGPVVSVAPGANLSLLLSNAVSGTAYQLGVGTYTVTPGAVLSNALAGISIFNKTNIAILGVPGLTIINGRSGLGEHLFLTNCSNVLISGITFLGLVQTNPPLGNQSVVHGILGYYACADLTIDRCSFLGMHDHGILDFGSQVDWNTPSTNGITIRDNFFRDGGFMTSPTTLDGTAIVPTGGTISRNTIRECLRGIEPYISSDSVPNPVFNTVIENNILINILDMGIGPAGSSNINNCIVRNNTLINEVDYTRRGTNVMTRPATGILWNGGLGWKITGNQIQGAFAFGISVGAPEASPQVGDGLIANNTIIGMTNNGAAVGISAVTLYRTPIVGNNISFCKNQAIGILGLRDSAVKDNQLLNPSLNAGLGIRIASFGSDVTSNVTVSGNYIFDAVAGRLATGIEDQLGGLLKISLQDNTIKGATANVLNQSGDQMFISGPPTVFNFTNDFPSLAAGGSFRTNFPAVGVKTNDLALLMVPDQFYRIGTNLITSAWCSNDTVWIYVHNAGPAAADPGSVRFKAIVRQVETY